MNKYGYFKYLDYAVGAKQDAEYSTNANLQTGSSLTQLSVGVKPYQYASLEQDAYITSKPYLLYKNGDLGFLTSAISNENGIFETPIVLTINFKLFYSMTGITISSRNVIKDIKIEAFQNETIVASADFSADKKEQFYPIDIKNANILKFTISKIDKPYTFFGIFNIEYGKIRDFTDKDLSKAEITKHFSLLGDSLEFDTLDLNVIKPEKEDYFFQKKQPLDYMIGEETKERFYIDRGIEVDEKSIQISAYDEISNLNDKYLGGMFDEDVKLLIDDILKGTEIEYDTSLVPNINLVGYLPISSRGKALQTVLQASGIRCYKKQKLVFKPIETVLSDIVLDQTNVLSNPKPKIEKKQPISSVKLTTHNYSKKTETMELYHWYISKAENITIEFSQPIHNLKAYEVTGVDENGSDIVSETPSKNVTFIKAEPNYCVVKNSSSNKIVIVGMTYADSKLNYKKVNPIISASETYVDKEINLTISSNAESLLNGLYGLYSRKNKITFKTLENLEIGGYYSILGNEYNITSIHQELNGIYEVEAE